MTVHLYKHLTPRQQILVLTTRFFAKAMIVAGAVLMIGGLVQYVGSNIVAAQTHREAVADLRQSILEAEENPGFDVEVEGDVHQQWVTDLVAPVALEKALPTYVPGSQPTVGSAFAIFTIPALDLEVPVVEGAGEDELKKGVGRLNGTALPGTMGNSVISGHRTTWGGPFNRIDELEEGDSIVIETSWGTHVYEVVNSFIVTPSDVWVAAPVDGAWLTLTTCHPKGSARERLIVRARLVDGPNLAYIDHMWPDRSWARTDA